MSLFTEHQLYSASGHKMTRALFKEMNTEEHIEPLLTLGRENGELPSLRTLFIEHVTLDPSEVIFAEYVFGDYAFWKHLSKTRWMSSPLEEWRMVTDARRKCEAFKAVMEEVDTKGRSAFTAAKFLIDESWKDKRKPGVKKAIQTSSGLASDIARIKDFKIVS